MMVSDSTKGEMADREGLGYVENPAGEQLLHGGETAQAQWPAPMVPIVKSHSLEDDHNLNYEHHHHHDHDHEHHHKKSVLTKVKEKAKKWKQVLTRRKHSHEDEGNTTPTSGVGLDEEEDESEEQDREHHGSTMYQSETALTMEKERAHPYQALVPSPKTPTSTTDHHHLAATVAGTRIASSPHQNPVPTPATKPNSSTIHNAQKEKPKLHHLDSFKETSNPQIMTSPTTANTLVTETKKTGEDPTNSTSKSVTETVTEMLTPAYNMVSEATHKIVAKIQSPTAKDETGAKMEWDKGVSVKEYLLHKLEPGEEERALSKVITEAISPRKGKASLGHTNMHCEEKSVVEKVREVVSSLLGTEEQTGPQISTHSMNPNSECTRVASKGTHGLLNQISEITRGASIPASKDVQTSILASEYQYTHETLNPFSEYSHGASNTTSESIDGASSVESKSTHGKSTHGGVIPTSEYIHGASIPALGRTYGAPVPVSEYVHGTAMPETKYNQGDSSPLPVSTNLFSSATSITENPSSMFSNTTSLHAASAYPHGASVPAYKGTDEASIHAFEHTQHAPIPASEYAHGVAMLESKYNSGHVLPLQVSTNPFSSATSVTKNPSLDHPSTNMSTFSDYTSHHAEVEETGGRRLQTN